MDGSLDVVPTKAHTRAFPPIEFQPMSAASPIPTEPDPASFRIRVLLVDGQLIIVEAVRRMLAAHPDIDFHYVTGARAAHAAALALRPTMILQDLVMPGAAGRRRRRC